MLGALPLLSAIARADGGTHDQAGCSTRRRIVVMPTTHGRTNRRTQDRANNGGAYGPLVAGFWPDRLLSVTAAILVFLGEQFQRLAGCWHDRDTRALWRHCTANQTNKTNACNRKVLTAE